MTQDEYREKLRDEIEQVKNSEFDTFQGDILIHCGEDEWGVLNDGISPDSEMKLRALKELKMEDVLSYKVGDINGDRGFLLFFGQHGRM